MSCVFCASAIATIFESPQGLETVRERWSKGEATFAEIFEHPRLAELIDGTEDALIVVDASATPVRWNAPAASLFGLGSTPPEGHLELGSAFFLLDAVTPCPIDQHPLWRALRGEDVAGEELIVGLPRSAKSVRVRAAAHRLRQGDCVVGAVMQLRCLDANSTRAAELRVRGGSYRELIRKIPDAELLIFDDALEVVMTEGAAIEGALPRGATFDTQPPSAESSDALVRLCRAALEGQPSELARESAGRARHLSIFPVRDDKGAILGGAILSRDLAKGSRVHTDRLAALGMLAASIAHEINNSLHCLLANVELVLAALEQSPSPTSIAEPLRDAMAAGLRIRTTVSDVRSMAHESRPVDELADVNRAMQTAIHLSLDQIQEKRSRVVNQLDRLPKVFGRESQLVQLFVNLLVNAAQALPGHHPDLNEIRIIGHDEGARVVVEVHDTGKGIAPEIMHRIFDPLFTTKASHGGMGIGLTICRAIVASFGGSIEIESELQRGTVVRLVFRTAI